MLVKATSKYEELKIKDQELKIIPKEGEKFEISEERYEILTKNNKFNEVFVEKVEETEEIEIATKKVETEKAIKKTRKKSK